MTPVPALADDSEDGTDHNTGHRDIGKPKADGAGMAYSLGSGLEELEMQAQLVPVGEDFKINATGQPLPSVSQKTPRQILTIQTFQIQ